MAGSYDGTHYIGIDGERIGDGSTDATTEDVSTGLDNRLDGHTRYLMREQRGGVASRRYVQTPQEGAKRLSTRVYSSQQTDGWRIKEMWPVPLRTNADSITIHALATIGGPPADQADADFYAQHLGGFTLNQDEAAVEVKIVVISPTGGTADAHTVWQGAGTGRGDRQNLSVSVDLSDENFRGRCILQLQLRSVGQSVDASSIQVTPVSRERIDVLNAQNGGNASTFKRTAHIDQSGQEYETLAILDSEAAGTERHVVCQPPLFNRDGSDDPFEVDFVNTSWIEFYGLQVSMSFTETTDATRYNEVSPRQIRAQTTVDGPDIAQIGENLDGIWEEPRMLGCGPFPARASYLQADARQHWRHVFEIESGEDASSYPDLEADVPVLLDQVTARIRAGATVSVQGYVALGRRSVTGYYRDEWDGGDIEKSRLDTTLPLEMEAYQMDGGTSPTSLSTTSQDLVSVPTYYWQTNAVYSGPGQLSSAEPLRQPGTRDGGSVVDGLLGPDSTAFLTPFRLSVDLDDPGTGSWLDRPVSFELRLPELITIDRPDLNYSNLQFYLTVTSTLWIEQEPTG